MLLKSVVIEENYYKYSGLHYHYHGIAVLFKYVC